MAKKFQAPELLSLEEVNERYFGEWVLLKVTQLDEHRRITRGEVLKHSKARAAISRAVDRAHRQDPTCHLYLFVGGTRKVTGDELREALHRVASENYVNARW